MISIVMAYFNRKPQLRTTLKSIDSSLVKDVEIIIVDDCSDPQHKLDSVFLEEFKNLKINVIEMDPEKKWYKNPCIPYNVGIAAATGDVTVLQNPECMHFGDILTEIDSNLHENEYISFPAYSLSKEKTDTIVNIKFDEEFHRNVIECVSPMSHTPYDEQTYEGWYNHSTIKPLFYHFCCAVHTKHLKEMGGFDERYSQGISYDDDEFVIRLKRKGLKMIIPTTPIVFHLFHEKFMFKDANFMKYVYKNRSLLEVTMNEGGWKVNEKT